MEETLNPTFLSHTFMVPKRDSDKPQLFISLSRLNQSIQTLHFWMLSLQQVWLTLSPDTWMVSLNLESVYWYMPIHPQFRKFLVVQVDFHILQFKVMPFGLNIMPRVFTKLTKVVSACLTSRRVSSFMYLDK